MQGWLVCTLASVAVVLAAAIAGSITVWNKNHATATSHAWEAFDGALSGAEAGPTPTTPTQPPFFQNSWEQGSQRPADVRSPDVWRPLASGRRPLTQFFQT